MPFYPAAFQFNAFQEAIGNVNRSGVVRLWLSKITAEMNNISWLGEEPKETATEAPAKPAEKPLELVENADGSVTAGTPEKPVKARQARRPVALKPMKEPVKLVPPSAFTERNLPQPHETAEFLLGQIGNTARQQAWAEEQVLELLRQAVEDQQEEEMLIEAAATLLL